MPMMTLEALRKSLGDRANEFSDEELTEIRRDLYQLAHLAFDLYKKDKQIFN